MLSPTQDQFEKDYLYIRRELVRGRNPFVTVQSMKDWIKSRVDSVVAGMVKEREKRIALNIGRHADREVEIYRDWLRRTGQKEDDE